MKVGRKLLIVASKINTREVFGRSRKFHKPTVLRWAKRRSHKDLRRFLKKLEKELESI